MPEPHVPTILAAIVAVDLALAISAELIVRRDREDGPRLWPAALCVHAAGVFLLAARGAIPDALSIVVSGAALSLALGLALHAVRSFFGAPTVLAAMLAPPVFVSIVHAVSMGEPLTRALVGNATLLFQAILVLRELRRGAPDWISSGRRVAILGVGIGAALSATRFVAAILVPETVAAPFAPAVGFSGLCGMVAIILVSTGFMLMSKERSDERLRSLAMRDRLTGCWNRVRVEEFARGEMSRLERYAHPVSMLMIDLDLFKTVNDSRGHMVGDEVLRDFSRVVERTIRSTDLLGRWGGEEFVVVMPSTGFLEASRVAERVRVALSEHAFPAGLHLTASIGVSLCRSTDNWEEWLGRADEALYRAKADGRDRVRSEVDLVRGGAPVGGEVVLHLVWRREFETGDAMEDAQHRAIFETANELASAGGDEESERAAGAMSRLIEQMRTHFAYEERRMIALGVARLGPHAEAHRRLLVRAERLLERFRVGGIGSAELFHFSINELVAQHFLIEDRLAFPHSSDEDESFPDLREASNT